MTKKLLIGILLAFVLLLGGTAIALKLMFPAERLQALVVAELEKRIDRKIALEGVSLAVFPSVGIDVRGLTVSDRPEFSTSRPFIHLDRFLLSLEFWPLFRRELIVDALVFDGPAISVIIDERGVANYADLTPAEAAPADTPTEAAAPLTVQISGIRINDGRLYYADRRTGLDVEVERLNDELSLSIDQAADRIISTGSLTMGDVRIKRPEGPMGGIEIRIDHDAIVEGKDRTITVNDLKVTVQQMTISLAGKITDYNSNAPMVDLAVKSSEVTIEKLFASIPPDMARDFEGITGRGRIDIEGTVKGAVGGEKPPAVHARLSLNDGMVRTPDIPVPVEKLTGNMELQDTKLTIHSLSAKIGRSDLSATGAVTQLYGGPAGSKPTVRLDLSSQFLDLDELVPPVSEGEPVPPYKPYPDIVLASDVTAGRVRVLGLDMTEASLRLSLQNQIVHITDLKTNAYGGRLTGTLSQDLNDINRPVVRIDTRVDTVDVGAFLDPFLPVKGLLHGRFSTNFSANGPLDASGNPVHNALTALGSLKLENGWLENWPPLQKASSFLKIKGIETIDFRTLAGLFRIENGRVVTDDLRLSGSKADWIASGAYGLDGSLDYHLQITFAEGLTTGLDNTLAGQALSLFRNEQGRVGVGLKVTGTLKEPKFGWDTSPIRDHISQLKEQGKQFVEEQKLRGQQLTNEKARELVEGTPLTATNMDTLKSQAQNLVKSGADTVKAELKDKAKDALKGLFRRNN